MKYDFFAFDTACQRHKCELERIMLEYSGADRRLFSDERINFLVSNAISEFQRDGFDSTSLLEAIFTQIMIYIVRNFCSAEMACPGRVTNPEMLCYRLMNYIDTHIYSMKHLEELADVTGYSYGYLSALFKKTTSGTLTAYYKNKKLDIARMLVLENKLKMHEIAEILNYASVYAFSKAFKQYFGSSPEKYRKQKTG
jgi:AraC-like DNA-binding protein